jgi:hypothetical protein
MRLQTGLSTVACESLLHYELEAHSLHMKAFNTELLESTAIRTLLLVKPTFTLPLVFNKLLKNSMLLTLHTLAIMRSTLYAYFKKYIVRLQHLLVTT